jgi:hypothetical protein
LTVVTCLVTFVDLDESQTDRRRLSLSVRHEAVLGDETRVPLLDDRGWSMSPSRVVGQLAAGESSPSLPHEVAAGLSVNTLEETARFVVGPDEPPPGRSREEMEDHHWTYLSLVLRQHGVVVDALALRQVRHDVVVSQRLLGLIGS